MLTFVKLKKKIKCLIRKKLNFFFEKKIHIVFIIIEIDSFFTELLGTWKLSLLYILRFQNNFYLTLTKTLVQLFRFLQTFFNNCRKI